MDGGVCQGVCCCTIGVFLYCDGRCTDGRCTGQHAVPPYHPPLPRLSSAQARAHKAETHVIRLQEQVHTLEHRAAKHSTTTQHAVAAQEKAQEKAQHLTRQLQSERAARQAAESQLTGACQQLERLREEYSHVVEQLASAQHELEHREVILMQQQQELTQLHQALQGG